MAKVNKSQQFASTCTRCEAAAIFVVEGTSAAFYDEAGYATEFYLSKCGNCSDVSLYARDDFGEGFDEDTFTRVYPVQKRKLGIPRLPELVKESYNEAVTCENARAWLACAVMVGRTLEAVSRDLDPKSKNLAASLKGLYEGGTISKDIYEWAQHLRISRNAAAHPSGASISSKDAVEALDFAQAIIEILYDLQPKFERMKKRAAREQART